MDFFFLTTLSRKIKLRTVEHVVTQTTASLISALNKVINMYARGGFIVNLIMMDQEFANLESYFDLVEINTTVAHKHDGEIEQSIRTIKERARAISTVLPFSVLPKQIVIHLV